MKIYLTASGWHFGLRGVHFQTKKGGCTFWPYDWIWYPRKKKYGWLQFW